MKKIIAISLLSVVLILSCNKDEITIDPGNLLLGFWNYSDYQGEATLYARSTDFADIQGYKFNADGSLTVRQNSGFCGTPPVTYADYLGSWTILNDTLIRVSSPYWGGTLTYDLDIEELNSNTLKVISIPVVK